MDTALRAVVALVTGNGGHVGYEALRSVLQRVAAENPDAPDRIALLEKLSDLAVIRETADDRSEMGVPNFGRHQPVVQLTRPVALRTSPVGRPS